MVPNGWEKTTFGEHIDLLNGFAFKSALYSDDENDIKLLRGDNIEPNKLRWRDVKRWSKTEYESLEKYHLKENDFIIAMDRTWITAGLKVAEVKQEDLPCLLVQRVSRIRSLPTLCQDLIKHHFSSYQFEQYVKSVQTETAVPHISATQIREFGLLLPPLPEQQKIAKILSTWDKAISTTERLIDNSTEQKKALMQQLLTGKKRLLDESGKRFEGEWEEVELADIGKCINGLTYSPSDVVESNGMLVLRSSNVQDGKLAFDDNVYVKSDLKVKSKTKEGDILVCVRNGSKNLIGKSALIKGKAVNEAHGAFMTLYRSIYPTYVFQLFQSNLFYRQVNKNLGATINSINTSDLHKFKFLIPSNQNEIKKIATVLINADKEIELLEQQLADLQQEKKALMQVLLTGKKRVVIDGEAS